ncbi:threonine/homoserine/homoserine lactone efflux protein [Dysgonomonas sp. PFB1-18]|uniref:LysE family translocator n=1 Tax=unclassified Dysgonomonas TaxID=2630389 RepID=UPI002473079B|nr:MULTISPECIES: LysE family transporter [unclassified Dysgonomonas]MDL2303171.1 LysE family transporter [Dysgonomonas sp. OttesenSCG-928-D17]MDH6308235.1 threonine/homoserine/homoserine lactone efflux protein [Dysgonomonas sp. PF1-14]MDH6338326.1 threonine/homoserine/homoserine lactone efflux protein [Dysgonomonas sp. PF1-16]MDH6379823.1 threonine/homoserine/homoserine lactone efflux protein [Dysgonomonas sp. PFB1-18]MDH6397087.1 threonine/homoserine/homoserine lactone efflux protein [Dysgono
MVYIIIKGLFIGFLSSAPMGPVGMLCVQRTLNEGRRNGLITGLGAVAGDMIIALLAIIAALGLGFSNESIQQHEGPLKVVGSIVLIVFGYFVFNKNPSKNLAKLNEKTMSYWKVFASSLILTISNIATLFLYIALFARFNVIDADKPFGYDLITIFFIGLGALLWWLLITFIVNKLRTRFNPRGLQIFNQIIGLLLIGLGIAGIITGTLMGIDFF